MGWEDRDYARADSPSRFGGGRLAGGGFARYSPRSVVKLLIYVNVGIYLLCILNADLASLMLNYGAMTRRGVMSGQVWRIVTSDYLHWGTMHLLWNMIGLYFLGRPLEQVWGPKKFFAVYTVSGIAGSLFYMVLTFYWINDGIAAGASGCVLGLLGACAVLFPHAEVWVYFLFPVKIRTAAMVMGIWYAWNIWQTGANAGGDACHLAGLVFGIWWVTYGDRRWTQRQHRLRPGEARPPQVGGFKQRLAQRKADVETVDRILAKVHETGIASLTQSEKRALAEATDRQHREERDLGRVDRI